MTSSQGTEYYLKSMNGIKVFDDGSGTVIEDDSITVKTIDCEIINAATFITDTFNLEKKGKRNGRDEKVFLFELFD